MKAPVLLVMAGPNGSGKSTITTEVQPIGHYVNADIIQNYLKCNPLDAAEIAENTREFLLSQKESFTFETVLSTERNYKLMQRAKEAGYDIICIFVLTVNPDINIKRVKSRVKKGGHGVPPQKIRERYYRAVRLFPNLFRLCDELYVYDNSLERTEGLPERIITYRFGELQISPNKIWSLEMLEALCSGNYSP